MDVPPLQPIGRAARLLSVPADWLRGEVEAGRLPHLRAGRRVLIHVDTVRRILSDRAQQEGLAAQPTTGGLANA
jgi:excisionase family DNA binding protein